MKKILLAICTLGALYGANAQRLTENLGSNVNTEYSELNPVITPDGRRLYYVIEGHPQNNKIGSYNDAQDIWYSEMDSSGKFSPKVHEKYPLNQRRYNGIQCTNPDGTIIYIRGAYEKGVYVGIGFSYIRKTANGYTEPEKLLITDFDKMAKGIYTNLTMSNDGQTAIIAFSTKEDSGINDFFVTFKQSNGTWSKPKYIKGLNTKYKESTPFIASDGKTLYFSSNRPGGFGSNDVYVAKRLDDTWMKWTAPKNLGADYNTNDWDAYYMVDWKADYAYMVSAYDGLGKEDIVRIKMKQDIRPDPVVMIKGRVLDSKTKKPVSADILYNVLSSSKLVGEVISDPTTGAYTIILPYGTSYAYHAEANKYFAITNTIDLTQVSNYQEINQDILMVPIEAGQTIQLNSVLFVQSKPEMLPSSYPELDRVVAMMKENPNIEIRLEGHTDNQGSADGNQTLSEQRVEAVKAYLVSKGVDEKRISTKGYGGTKPIASNYSEETRKLNRRVEFVITKF
ncbi:MAG: OmpA family protein [Cytophagaceae bacterium]